MRLFFIGSLPHAGTRAVSPKTAAMSLKALGAQAAANGHQFIVCSPYPGSADLEVIQGAAEAGLKSVEVHYPSSPEVRERVALAARELGLALKGFDHPFMDGANPRSVSYSWLLAQLAALDACDVIVAAGGRLGGSAGMLLHQAEAKRRPMVPLGHLGGEAALSLERQRYRLLDRLGEMFAWLHDPNPPETFETVVRAVAEPESRALPGARNSVPRVFISYARCRPEEADLTEMTLRRRGFEVFRDEHNFKAGAVLLGEVEEHMARCDVFVALWSRDYACSPWCHDELAAALVRAKAGTMSLWLLRVDDVRIVPPDARGLVSYDCFERDRLASTLANLSDRAGRE